MRILNRRRMQVGLALLATVSVAGCTASLAPRPSASALNLPVSLGTAAPSSRPAVTPSANTTSGGAVRNLIITGSVRSALIATYVAFWHLKASDIGGTTPGSVYYAYDAATGTYWARAGFAPSATASELTITDQQDGDSVGLFTRTSDGAWQMSPEGDPPGCGILRFLPKAVITAWALPQPMLSCPISTG